MVPTAAARGGSPKGAPRYSDFRTALSDVPDPRDRRGRRYPWRVLLTLVGAALAAGEHGLRGIAQCVAEHAEELRPLVGPPPGRVPSPAALRRAVRAIGVEALEERVARFVAALPPTPRAAPSAGGHRRQ